MVHRPYPAGRQLATKHGIDPTPKRYAMFSDVVVVVSVVCLAVWHGDNALASVSEVALR